MPALEAAVAALLEDLELRGLLDTTIVDHARRDGPDAEDRSQRRGPSPLGHEPVRVRGRRRFQRRTFVGATDKIGAYVKDKHYKVESYGRTLYHLLGIDSAQELYTTSNRPLKIILEDAPLIHEALD